MTEPKAKFTEEQIREQKETRAIVANNSLSMLGLRSLLDNPDVTDIAINTPNYVWIETSKGWQCQQNDKLDYYSLKKLANALCVYSGVKGTFGQDLCISAVTLPTGERGHILTSPTTEANTIAFSFRCPSRKRFTLQDYENTNRTKGFRLIQKRELKLEKFQEEILTNLKNDDLTQAFKIAIANKLNIALIGGTGSGKTTLTKALADIYPVERRYITIETSHELDLPLHPNKVHLFYDDEYQDKKKTSDTPGLVISPHDCIKACMRMKPDHIFVTELRGSEAWYYFEALNTGHRGSLTTFHANDTVSSYERLLDMLRENASSMAKSDKDIIVKAKKTIDMIVSMERSYVTEVYYNPEEQLSLYKEDMQDL